LDAALGDSKFHELQLAVTFQYPRFTLQPICAVRFRNTLLSATSPIVTV
jgi:hypothetical protein